MNNAAIVERRREAADEFGSAGGDEAVCTVGRQYTTRSRTEAKLAAARKPVRESGQDREVERALGLNR